MSVALSADAGAPCIDCTDCHIMLNRPNEDKCHTLNVCDIAIEMLKGSANLLPCTHLRSVALHMRSPTIVLFAICTMRNEYQYFQSGAGDAVSHRVHQENNQHIATSAHILPHLACCDLAKSDVIH